MNGVEYSYLILCITNFGCQFCGSFITEKFFKHIVDTL